MAEPTRLGEILPGLMADIDRRMQSCTERHRRRVIDAIGAYQRSRRGGRDQKRNQESVTESRQRQG